MMSRLAVEWRRSWKRIGRTTIPAVLGAAPLRLVLGRPDVAASLPPADVAVALHRAGATERPAQDPFQVHVRAHLRAVGPRDDQVGGRRRDGDAQERHRGSQAGARNPLDRHPRHAKQVAHEYFGVDVKVLWETVREDLPSLLTVLRAVLARPEFP
jgi:hypothetical protein